MLPFTYAPSPPPHLIYTFLFTSFRCFFSLPSPDSLGHSGNRPFTILRDYLNSEWYAKKGGNPVAMTTAVVSASNSNNNSDDNKEENEEEAENNETNNNNNNNNNTNTTTSKNLNELDLSGPEDDDSVLAPVLPPPRPVVVNIAEETSTPSSRTGT